MAGLRLIVGLGNPGPEYARTRHNAGFRFVDALAAKAGASFRLDSKLFGETAKIDIAGRPVWLLKPATFMNLSGKSVTAALRFWKFEPEQALLAHDELDLPPGTGDIPLTLAQAVPVSTAVVVTTPQNLALADARRGVAMFAKVNIPVCGVVENMSYFRCGHCGTTSAIFGDAGGERLAAECGVPVLAQIPLDIAIRRDADEGAPTVARSPEHEISQLYRQLGQKIGLYLWQQHAAANQPVAIAIN